jgi:hypothetical protein
MDDDDMSDVDDEEMDEAPDEQAYQPNINKHGLNIENSNMRRHWKVPDPTGLDHLKLT